MGKGTSTTSLTQNNQNVQYTPYAQKNFADIYNKAGSVASQPYNPYTGELVAPVNGYQFSGLNQIMDAGQQAQPYIQQAASQTGEASNDIRNAYNQVGQGLPWLYQGAGQIGQGANMIADAQSPLWQGEGLIRQGGDQISAAQGYIGEANNAALGGLNTINQGTPYVGQGGNYLNQGIGIAGSGIGNIGAGLGAMQQGLGTTGGANPLFGAGAGMAGAGSQGVGSINPYDIQSYMNPFQSQVIQATMANMAEDNAQQQQQVLGNAAMRGALGGDRVGVAQSELARQQALANNQTLAGLNAQNYQQATQTALTQQQNAQANQARMLQGAGLMGSLGSQTGQLGATQAGIGQGIAGTANQYGQLGATIGGLGQGYAGLGSLMANIGSANLSGANAIGGLGALQAGVGSQTAGAGNALVGSAGQQAGLGNLYAGTGMQYANLAGQNSAMAGQMGGLGSQIGGLGSQYGNLGIMGQNAGITGGQSLMQAGMLPQQTQQALDTANYQQYLQQLAFPYQQAQFMAGIGLPAAGAMGGYQTQIGNTNQVLTPPGMSTAQGIIGGGALIGGLLGGFGQNRGGRIEGFKEGGGIEDEYRDLWRAMEKSAIPTNGTYNIPETRPTTNGTMPATNIPQASNPSALTSMAQLASLGTVGKNLGSGLSNFFGSGSAADASILGATGAEDAGLAGDAALGAAGLGAGAAVGDIAAGTGGLTFAEALAAGLIALNRGGGVGYDEGGAVNPLNSGGNPYAMSNIIPKLQPIQTPKVYMGEMASNKPPMDIARAASAMPGLNADQMTKLGTMASRLMSQEESAAGGRINKYPTGGAVYPFGWDPTNRFPYPPPVPQQFPPPLTMDFPKISKPDTVPDQAPEFSPEASAPLIGITTDPATGSGGGSGDGSGFSGGPLAGDQSVGNPGSAPTGNAVQQAADRAGDFHQGAPPAPPSNPLDDDNFGQPDPAAPAPTATPATPATPSPGLPDPGGLFNTGTPASTANPTSSISITQDMASPAPESGMFNGSFGAIPGAPGFNNSGSLFGQSDMFGAPTATLAEQMGLNDINASPSNALNSNALDAISQSLDDAAVSAIAQEAAMSSPSPAPPGYSPGDMADTSDVGSVTGTGSVGLSGLGGAPGGAFAGVGGMGMGGLSGLGGGVVGASVAAEADGSPGVGILGSDVAGDGQSGAVTGDAAAGLGAAVGLGDAAAAGLSGEAAAAADASGAGLGVSADAGNDAGGGGGDRRGGRIRAQGGSVNPYNFMQGYDDGGDVEDAPASFRDRFEAVYPKDALRDRFDAVYPSASFNERFSGAPERLPQPRPAMAGIDPSLDIDAAAASAQQQGFDPGRASWADIMNTNSPAYANQVPQRKTVGDILRDPRERSNALMRFGAGVLASNPAHGWGAAIGQGLQGTINAYDKQSTEDLTARQHAQKLASDIKKHVDSYTQETAHQKRTSDIAEERNTFGRWTPVGKTESGRWLIMDQKTGELLDAQTRKPPDPEDKISGLGLGNRGGTNPQMVRHQLAQMAYPNDPQKAAEVALGIRPPTDLQLDSYLVKNFPQLAGKGPEEIRAYREAFKQAQGIKSGEPGSSKETAIADPGPGTRDKGKWYINQATGQPDLWK